MTARFRHVCKITWTVSIDAMNIHNLHVPPDNPAIIGLVISDPNQSIQLPDQIHSVDKQTIKILQLP
jgi:hypothetical protein